MSGLRRYALAVLLAVLLGLPALAPVVQPDPGAVVQPQRVECDGDTCG